MMSLQDKEGEGVGWLQYLHTGGHGASEGKRQRKIK